MGEIFWSEPIITADSHRLLHVSRIDTGKTVMLPARVPIGRKLPTLVQCKIYHLDDGRTIAIGKYDDLTIIYQAERGDHHARIEHRRTTEAGQRG